jgi:hypothetical protein
MHRYEEVLLDYAASGGTVGGGVILAGLPASVQLWNINVALGSSDWFFNR